MVKVEICTSRKGVGEAKTGRLEAFSWCFRMFVEKALMLLASAGIKYPAEKGKGRYQEEECTGPGPHAEEGSLSISPWCPVRTGAPSHLDGVSLGDEAQAPVA